MGFYYFFWWLCFDNLVYINAKGFQRVSAESLAMICSLSFGFGLGVRTGANTFL